MASRETFATDGEKNNVGWDHAEDSSFWGLATSHQERRR